ncbi:MAG: hypothetical protein UIM53_05455 [Acutalibacteraceae bacterium]|nr:hypothetical protein [Acutalibacteraceae bacterium]
MKIFDVIRLSLLNIKCNIKMAMCIGIGFFIINFIILVSFSYGYSMNNHLKDLIDNSISQAYLSIADPLTDDEIRDICSDSSIEGVFRCHSYDYPSYLKNMDSSLKIRETTLDEVCLTTDDNVYYGVNDFSYDFGLDEGTKASRNDKQVLFRVSCIDFEDSLQFASCELREFNNNFDGNLMLYGKDFNKEKQIILSDYMLEKFGVNKEEQEKYVGKKISLSVKTPNGYLKVIDDYQLCGIIDSNFYRVSSREKLSQIMVSSIDEDYIGYSIERIFCYNFSDLVKFYDDNDEEKLIPTRTAFEVSEIEAQKKLFNDIISISGVILVFTILTFVNLLIFFYFKRRKNFIGMEKAMGLDNIRLYVLIFVELLSLGVVSLVIAFPVYMVTSVVIDDIFKIIIASDFCTTISENFFALAISSVSTVAFVVVFTTIQYLKTLKCSVIKS